MASPKPQHHPTPNINDPTTHLPPYFCGPAPQAAVHMVTIDKITELNERLEALKGYLDIEESLVVELIALVQDLIVDVENLTQSS